MAELSVLIVNYNTWQECAQAVASLRENGPTRPNGSPMPFECVVVDNASPLQPEPLIRKVEHELALLREQQGDDRAGVLIRHTENGGYSKGMNLAFAHSRGRQILISNPDLIFLDGLISRLQRALEADPKIGIAVPKGYWDPELRGHLPPNTLPTLGDAWGEALATYSRAFTRRRAKRLLRSWMKAWDADEPLNLPMMSGCLFLIERDYFESLGCWDERYPLYYEDADLSVAIRKSGRTITQVPDASLIHFVNRSGMSDLETMWSRNRVSKQRYYAKWYGALGRLTTASCRWLVSNKLMARLRSIQPKSDLIDLGSSADKPVLELPRSCERFVVLMSLDYRFFLAAGIYGSGDRWTPTDVAFSSFVSATFFFQVHDLSSGAPELLGTWRYDCRSHLGHSVEPVQEGS